VHENPTPLPLPDTLADAPPHDPHPRLPNPSSPTRPTSRNPPLCATGGSDPVDPQSHPQAKTPQAARPRPDPAGNNSGGQLVAWTGFVFGSVMSIAANVLHAWLPADQHPPGWTPPLTTQIGAAVWPIGLLISVEVLSRVAWPAGWQWALARYGGAGTVALGSAIISYGHLHGLLQAWGYGWLGSAVGPLVLDGLMTVSGFALLAQSAMPATDATPENHLSPSEPPQGGDRVAQLLAEGAGRRRLVKELGITDYRAKKLLGNHRATERHTPASDVAANGHTPWTADGNSEDVG
jgi:hypothetical protein